MALLKTKQISAYFDALIGLTGFATSAAGSKDISSDLATAVTTAGRGGVAVPQQVATSETTEGWILGEELTILDAQGGSIESADDTHVYGKITEAAGVYTLTYYYLNASGTETAYTFAADTTVSIYPPYRFTLDHLPVNAITGIRVRDVSPAAGASEVVVTERLTITADNTVPNITDTPKGAVQLVVNGKVEDSGTGGAFTIAGKVITWVPADAYKLETTDRVVAIYVK